MSDPAAFASIPPPLPPIEPFLKAARTYRNRRTLNTIVSFSFLSLPCVSVVVADLTHNRSPGGRVPSFVFYIGAAIFLGAIVTLFAKAIRNVREPMEITGDGIRTKDNFWYWPQVKSIEPKKVSFADQYFLRVDLRVSPKVCLLTPDPAPSKTQCAEIIARLRRFLAASHPTITVHDIPR